MRTAAERGEKRLGQHILGEIWAKPRVSVAQDLIGVPSEDHAEAARLARGQLDDLGVGHLPRISARTDPTGLARLTGRAGLLAAIRWPGCPAGLVSTGHISWRLLPGNIATLSHPKSPSPLRPARSAHSIPWRTTSLASWCGTCSAAKTQRDRSPAGRARLGVAGRVDGGSGTLYECGTGS